MAVGQKKALVKTALDMQSSEDPLSISQVKLARELAWTIAAETLVPIPKQHSINDGSV